MSTSHFASRKRGRHGNVDRISNLPEGIMEKILFRCLPASDSIRMSFVSKTWQSLWKSLPVFKDFEFDTEDFPSMEKFVTSVDDSLGILHGHEHRRHIIPYFCLTGSFDDEMLSSHVDRWMKLVSKHYVETLFFHNCEKIPKYKFPPAAFDVGSLVELSLDNCILKKDLVKEDTRFCSLKLLELKEVDFDELVIGNLLSRCPSLETLEIIFSKNIEYLELVEFPKLRRVSLTRSWSEVYKYKIELTSLETLTYAGLSNTLDLEAICCSNLKDFHLFVGGTGYITSSYIQELNFRFPRLSNLTLRASSFAGDEIRLSSNQLKSLYIGGDIYAKNVSIDAPELLSYRGESKEVPSSFAVNFEKLKLAYHRFEDVRNLHTEWFLKLRHYLGNFAAARTLAVTISRPHVPTINFSSRELQKQEIIPPPPREVKDLVLDDIPWINDHENYYTALIDGLLWSCHPFMIRMPTGPVSKTNNSNLTKFVYRILTEIEENPQCCRDSHIKCWRHYLKSVKHNGFRGTKDGRTSYITDSAVSLLDFEEVTEATFKLQWLSEN